MVKKWASKATKYARRSADAMTVGGIELWSGHAASFLSARIEMTGSAGSPPYDRLWTCTTTSSGSVARIGIGPGNSALNPPRCNVTCLVEQCGDRPA